MTISLFIIVAALVFLFLAAFNVPSGRVSFGWLGMSLWLLSTVIRV